MFYFVVAMIAGAIFAYLGFNDGQLHSNLEKNGKVAAGEILGGEWSSRRRRGTTYKMDVLYTPEGKSPVTKSFTVTSGFFKSHATEGMITNDQCQVRYLPTDPETAIIVDGSKNSSWLMWPGIVAFVVGMIGTGVGIGRKYAAA